MVLICPPFFHKLLYISYLSKNRGQMVLICPPFFHNFLSSNNLQNEKNGFYKNSKSLNH